MRTSVSLPEELAAYVRATSSAAGENNAEAIRETLRHARTLEDRIDVLETRVEALESDVQALETENERLKHEKQQLIERRETTQELVAYVEGEREQRQAWEEAGLATRVKWWLFGRDRGDE